MEVVCLDLKVYWFLKFGLILQRKQALKRLKQRLVIFLTMMC